MDLCRQRDVSAFLICCPGLTSYRRSSMQIGGRHNSIVIIISVSSSQLGNCQHPGARMVGAFVVGGRGRHWNDALPSGQVASCSPHTFPHGPRQQCLPHILPGPLRAAPPLLGMFGRNRLGVPPAWKPGAKPHLVRLTSVWGPGVINSSLQGCVIQLVTQGSRISPLPSLMGPPG